MALMEAAPTLPVAPVSLQGETDGMNYDGAGPYYLNLQKFVWALRNFTLPYHSRLPIVTALMATQNRDLQYPYIGWIREAQQYPNPDTPDIVKVDMEVKARGRAGGLDNGGHSRLAWGLACNGSQREILGVCGVGVRAVGFAVSGVPWVHWPELLRYAGLTAVATVKKHCVECMHGCAGPPLGPPGRLRRALSFSIRTWVSALSGRTSPRRAPANWAQTWPKRGQHPASRTACSQVYLALELCIQKCFTRCRWPAIHCQLQRCIANSYCVDPIA